MTILLTGFEPFGGAAENPSQDIVRAVAKAWPDDEKLIAEILPVAFDDAGARIEELIAQSQPRVILMLGLAGESTRPRLERVALNISDAALPDNAGSHRKGQTIRKGAALALETALDLPSLHAHLLARGHGVDISNHAGTYVCNHIYYLALLRLAEMGSPARCLFMHVPPNSQDNPEYAQRFEALSALTRDLIAVLVDE